MTRETNDECLRQSVDAMSSNIENRSKILNEIEKWLTNVRIKLLKKLLNLNHIKPTKEARDEIMLIYCYLALNTFQPDPSVEYPVRSIAPPSLTDEEIKRMIKKFDPMDQYKKYWFLIEEIYYEEFEEYEELDDGDDEDYDEYDNCYDDDDIIEPMQITPILTEYDQCSIMRDEKYQLKVKNKTKEEIIQMAINGGYHIIEKYGKTGQWYLKGKGKQIVDLKILFDNKITIRNYEKNTIKNYEKNTIKNYEKNVTSILLEY